jgi:hypothetical protein
VQQAALVAGEHQRTPIIGDVLGQVLGKQLHDRARQGDLPGARPRLERSTHDLADVPASEG